MMWSLLAQAAAPDMTDAATTTPAVDPNLRANTVGEGLGRLQGLSNDVYLALPSLGVGLLVLLLFIVVGWLLRWGLRKLGESKGGEKRNLFLAVGRLAFGFLIVLGVLVACVIVFPNFTPTGLLTSLGVGGVVLGIAFKDVLQNYLAGILLLIAEPFRIGDQIIFKDYEGTVRDIQTRATFIRTYDGRRVVIPNAELFTNSVTVNTAFDTRRLEYDFGIGYGDDIDHAKRIILDTIRDTGVALDNPPPEILTYELAGSSVNLRARWWIAPPQKHDSLDARDAVLTAVAKNLLGAGIDLPFPTQQILFHDQTETSDGNRRDQREGWPASEGDRSQSRYEASRSG